MSKGQDGYTLIELLVVMALIAVLSATALPYLGVQRLRNTLATDSDSFVAALQEAQTKAVSRNRPTIVQFDAKTRTISIDGVASPVALSAQVTVKAVAVRQADPSIARYVFLPTGESSGGAITLTFQGESRRIEINWLTGAITNTGAPAS